MKAKEIMRRNVVTVGAHLTVPELAKLFADRCISGAPVVDALGNVLGVVSQTDLLRARRELSPGVPSYHAAEEELAASNGMHIEDMDNTRVEQIMTPGPICFDENASVPELAAMMTKLHIHRVLITRKSRLSGIVTTMDMMRALLPPRKRKAPRPRTRAR